MFFFVRLSCGLPEALLRLRFSSGLPVPRHARLPESAHWVHPCLPTCATPVLLKHHIIRPDPSWPPRSACPALLLPASELLLPLDFLPLPSPASSTRLLRFLLPFINDQLPSALPDSSHQHQPSCLSRKYWTPSPRPLLAALSMAFATLALDTVTPPIPPGSGRPGSSRD